MQSGRGLKRPAKAGSSNILAYLILAGVALFGFSTGVFYQYSSTDFGSNEYTVNGKLREKVMSDQLTSLQRQLAQRDGLIRELDLERGSYIKPETHETSAVINKIKTVSPPIAPIETKLEATNDFKKSKEGCVFQVLPGYLPECSREPCTVFLDLDKALSGCALQTGCGGVTEAGGQFELRAAKTVKSSDTGEVSYIRLCPDKQTMQPIGQRASEMISDRAVYGLTERKKASGKESLSSANTISMNNLLSDMGKGGWSKGNAEPGASLILVHNEDPLPAFYDPSMDGFTGEGRNDMGSFVDGLPTIYLKVASYRDELCHLTLADAFTKAAHPERLFIGIVEQNAKEDTPCLQVDEFDEACPANASPKDTSLPILCRFASHVRLYKQHAKDATGPTFARHVGDRLYQGEYFVLQTDAHMTFVTGWDNDIVGQFDAAKNQMAVLSTYPTEVIGSLDAQGRSRHKTTPVMCETQFTSEGLLRHGSAMEVYPMFGDSPILEPFWAAGFSFARGHFAVNVPYDCCTPMMFQGEEIDIAVRAWTKGYDLYTPHNSVAFHPYSRKSKPPMFWENSNQHKGEGTTSAYRVQGLIKIGTPKKAYDQTDSELYGLGSERDVEDFYKIFGIDRGHRTITKKLCAWSTSGRMHRQLSQFIRPNGNGIDYKQAILSLGVDAMH